MDLCKELKKVFSWTGLGPPQGPELVKVYKSLYDLPIPSDVKFLDVDVCWCNMGHCGAPLSVKDLGHVDTYGEAIALWADERRGMDGTTHYEYPDSMWLVLDWQTEPIVFYPKGCYNRQTKAEFTPPTDARYIAISWTR